MTDKNEQWETVQADVEKPVGVVISARLPRHVADEIFREARRQGVTTSLYVREALEAFLEGGATPTDISISSPDTSVTWYAGRSRQSRTAASVRADLEEPQLA